MTRPQREIHNGDGSHRRWETEAEYWERDTRERRQEHLAAKAEALSQEYHADEEDE